MQSSSGQTAASPRLQGKVAIITGGGSGFGEAIAKLFASHGAKVVISDINDEGGARVASSSDAITYVNSNVVRGGDWQNLLQKTQDLHGRVDIVVNNAGTSYHNKATLEVTEDEFDRVFAVNVKSIYHSVATIVPKLIQQKDGGSFINIASIGALRPRPGLVWYNASKSAVYNATKGLAAEYGPYNIRVNSICPLLSGTGLFETFVGVKDTPENREKFLGNVPLGRLCEPSDVANAVLFLASDDAKFVTGTCLEVDGGRGV